MERTDSELRILPASTTDQELRELAKRSPKGFYKQVALGEGSRGNPVTWRRAARALADVSDHPKTRPA